MDSHAESDELEISEQAIDSDLRERVANVEPSTDHGPLELWRGFLAHARRPLAYGDRFERDPDNDQLRFVLERTGSGAAVSMERRIGVVVGYDYEGTIIARCSVVIEPHEPCAELEDHFGIEAYGLTSGGVEAFIADVEACAAFAAFIQSRIVSVRAIAQYS